VTLRRLFLCYLVLCGVATAANCKKEFSPGIEGLNFWSFLYVHLNTHIIIRSAGHTTEFVFLYSSDTASIFVDGEPVQSGISSADASEQVASICGPAFEPAEDLFPGAGKPIPFSVPSPSAVKTLPVGQTSEDTVIADFNGDGVRDTAGLYGAGVFVTLRGANGAALSTAQYPITGIGVSQNIVTGDFNHDGVPDLAVTQGTFATSANPFPSGNVVVLLGKPDGSFGTPSSFPAGPVGSSYLAAGDFNGDGTADLALTHTVSAGVGRVAVLLGKGDGSFGGAVDYPVGPTPYTLVAADFNGDGKLDLATLDAYGSPNKVWVMAGRGDGSFQPAVSSASLSTEGHLAYADFNHDGKLDLLIPDRLASAMEVMLGNGDGTFQPGKEYLAAAQPVSIGILPLGDGNTALTTADNAADGLFLYFVNSDGTVQSPELQMIGSRLSAVAAADLNGDRQPDLVMTDTDAGQIYVKLASGKTKFATAAAYPAGPQPGALAVADLNGDAKPDVIAADLNGLDVLLGKGDGTLGAVNFFPAAGTLTSVTVADFNSDGKPDVGAASPTGGGVALFAGNGNGGFQTPQTIPVTRAQAAASGDFNDDGKPDLIVTNGIIDLATPGSLAVLLGKGDGTFQSSANIALPGPLLFTVAPAVADLNGDGKMDVIVPIFDGGQTKIVVLLGNGDGTFQGPIATESNTATTMISVADLDGDGKPDLLLGSCCGLTEAGYLPGNGDGTFQAELQFPSGPDPSGIAVADFSGDGRPDLAIIGRVEGEGPDRGTLTVLINTFTSGPASGANPATVVSSANPTATAIAPGSLATAYGTDLAQGTPGATSLPLPPTFGGTTVSLVDSAGNTWPAPLVYVSAAQVNFLVPAGVAFGAAQVTIGSGDGTISTAAVQVAAVAPGLFTLNAANLVAANAIRVSADGTQQLLNVYSVDGSGAVVAKPLNLSSNSDVVYLVLFGTGLQAAGTAGVKVTVGTTPVTVQYAGPQGGFAGLDQVNVILPHSLAGSGNVAVQLTASGVSANPVNLTIQ
jgi:uncharacterized protein (TIGR03437 family)